MEELLNEVKELIQKNYPRLLLIKDASKELNIGTQALRKLSNLKDFPVVKIGSKRLINMSEINNWLNKHRGEEFDL